jgi:tetratricopeptide (TPR) repeat protein
VIESGEAIDRAPARRGLAEVAWRSGDPRQVVELLAEEEEGAAASNEARGWRADRLGRAYLQLAEYEKAIATLEGGLDEARSEGDEPDVLRLSTLLANAMLDSGNAGRAEELLAQALRLAERASDPIDLARVWWSQSRVHIQQSRPDLAAAYVRKTIGLLEASEHSAFAAAAFQLLARIENDRGNGREALDLVERGQDAAAASGDRYFVALFELERARALAHLGERAEAASVAMRASALLEESNPSAAGRGYGVIADVYRKLGDRERACEIYELATERLPDADPFKIEMYTRLGELFEEDGRTEEAMVAYKQAAQLRTHAAAYRT